MDATRFSSPFWAVKNVIKLNQRRPSFPLWTCSVCPRGTKKIKLSQCSSFSIILTTLVLLHFVLFICILGIDVKMLCRGNYAQASTDLSKSSNKSVRAGSLRHSLWCVCRWGNLWFLTLKEFHSVFQLYFFSLALRRHAAKTCKRSTFRVSTGGKEEREESNDRRSFQIYLCCSLDSLQGFNLILPRGITKVSFKALSPPLSPRPT